MAQLIRITSEALQATIRRLLPSQQGFGEDLQASNVITPIIDLTPTAEGSILRSDLQIALDINITSQYIAPLTTSTLTSTPGFYYVSYAINHNGTTGNNGTFFNITDGITTKQVHAVRAAPGTAENGVAPVFYVSSGESLTCQCEADMNSEVKFRQIADINGNLVNPAGFSFQ